MKVKNIVIAILVIALGGMIVYRITKNKSENEKGNDKNGKKPPVSVSAVVVTPQEFSNTISLSGSIDANEQIEIRSEVSGIVETISFTEGSNVSKGQVLFKVNDIELRAQLTQAKTRESLASENERRAKLLLQKEAISQEEYDIASADFRTAKAQTQLIQAQIGKTTVRAPFSGKIGLRSISPGTYVTPATLIAKLVSTNPLKITFSIPEKYATEITKNAQITFTVPNVSDKFTAKIYAMEPGIEATTRTLQIRALTDNAKGNLLPGTFANIELPLKNIKDAIIVPTEAIIPIQEGKKVFISSNGKAKEVIVETLTRTDKDVVITSGLKIGDTVLTSGVMSLKEDDAVKVKLK
ncbi:efflux RND transporter periplasmic adaptor subunit [Flavobacterium terrisoli]|uniref:efflux RND transporter periplasmic adaptor subunit n=1 Tax=Flavobacterium terrisoli TaxID=3242195 RepID=UPI0025432137|nr:efflux RND transporter periplasmic adaptor subunit [Flavobacterium buctense]